MMLKSLITVSLWIVSAWTAHATYISEILSDNPIVYYPFDETSGTTTANLGSLGSSHDGTINGTVGLGMTGPIVSSSANNRAFDLMGGGNSIFGNTPVSSAGFGADGSYSIEVWFKERVDHQGDLVALVNPSGDQHGLLLEFLPNNDTMRYLHRSPSGSSGGQNINPSSLTHTTGNWHHLVAVNDSNTMRLYLDGVLDTTTATSSAPVNFDLNITLGQLRRGSGLRSYDGMIDEFALYDQALSEARIQSHFMAAAIPEPSSAALLLLGTGLLMARLRRQ